MAGLGFGVKAAIGLIAATLLSGVARGELCTTQSQMTTADRDQLAGAARNLALKVQAGDADGVKALTVPEYVKEFSGIAYVVNNTSPKIKDGAPIVDQIYLLDASTVKKQADGSYLDAQFFCSLNRSPMETDFVIPGLPPGKYGFAMVNFHGHPVPWRISILFRQEGGQWQLAGLYPQPQTAAGHDGLWYWKGAREMTAEKQPWNAWLYYQQAQNLLRPVGFVQSSHLEKLRTEQGKAAPPALSDGIGPETPLVVKGPDGAEYRFTSLDTDDSLAKDEVDVAVHLKAEAIADPIAARKRNAAAMTALLTVYPELRKPFHGVWVFADTGAQGPFATEQAMSEIP